MNLTTAKNLVRRFAIPLIAILIIVLIAILFLNSRKTEEDQSPKQTSDFVIPPLGQRETLSADLEKKRQAIIAGKIAEEKGDIVLFKTEVLEIEYVPTPDVFFVKILKEPVKIHKDQAQDWFLDLGLEQKDLCVLPVRFILDFKLKNSNPNFDVFPDGCKP